MLTSEEQPASPEEQALYEKFVSKAFLMVYDKKFIPKVLEMLAGGDDPLEGLAVTASMVIARVMKAAKDAGQKLPGDVAFAGAKEIFEDLAELSRRAGIKDYSQDRDALEGAMFRTMDQLRMILEQSGDIDREAAKADLAMLQEMDQSGQLERLFMDLAQKDEAAGAQPQAPATSEAPPKRRGGLMPQGER
ncbi:hypothetical protein [Fulvimarina endophytica]|nr:hypothetical protein [Fulvimarina endophytica]